MKFGSSAHAHSGGVKELELLCSCHFGQLATVPFLMTSTIQSLIFGPGCGATPADLWKPA